MRQLAFWHALGNGIFIETMDKAIPQRGRRTKRIILASILAILFLFLFWITLKSMVVVPQVKYADLEIAEVRYGNFQEMVLVNGISEPIHTVLIDARDGGTIQQIFADEGQQVQAGQVLIKLNNEAVTLDFMQRETQMVEQINNLRNTRIALEQNQRLSQDRVMNLQRDFELAQRKYLVDSGLYLSETISYQEWFETKVNFEYLKSQSNVLSKRLQKDLLYEKQQIKRIDPQHLTHGKES